ncbi:hypothetical protein [Pseudomonas sp. UBA2684]|uniref:hypothetical protein n=1 Tax=Pseudomonas sp. UBA2684 TaxID=1947311 RepID=UPI000E90BAF9|nr:hypothetical protein [Pseudomonas sp. UBA2684]HBX56619.1 hypothetical protein [Pseudomonas sp.]|tara:strand:- start:1451 stop:1897 length:447 start_codon:yes stop_codon:yes gene_type:complete
MVQVRRAEASGGLYERLLQRLALALDEADSVSRLSAEPTRELELRDLTSAELELIRAYLDRDVDWLRGWHAAAEELAVIEHWPARTVKPGRVGHKPDGRALGKTKPLLKRRMQLCCALCGVAAEWQTGHGVQACTCCGSQLFRANNPR